MRFGTDTVTIEDDEAVELTSGWWHGQDDPLYSIGSLGGIDIPREIVEHAVSNLGHDLRSVTVLGRGKYRLGRGTFTRAEIDELVTMKDAFERALLQAARRAAPCGCKAGKKAPRA